MGLAAETSSFSENPKALYSRCNAAKKLNLTHVDGYLNFLDHAKINL